MDKTGWIVVTLCAGLLGLQMYYNSTDEQQPAAPATPAAATAPADNTATATAPAAAPAATTVATAPAAPAPAAEKKVIATLTSKDAEGKPVARYNFSNIGGSISNVEMLGQVINSIREELKNTDVCINSNPDAGIGNLVFGLSNDRAPQFDQAVYEYRADLSNDNQVTLLDPLANLEWLNIVNADYNPEITDLLPLDSCQMLLKVNVYGTKVTEVSFLTAKSIIVNFDPTINQ